MAAFETLRNGKDFGAKYGSATDILANSAVIEIAKAEVVVSFYTLTTLSLWPSRRILLSIRRT